MCAQSSQLLLAASDVISGAWEGNHSAHGCRCTSEFLRVTEKQKIKSADFTALLIYSHNQTYTWTSISRGSASSANNSKIFCTWDGAAPAVRTDGGCRQKSSTTERDLGFLVDVELIMSQQWALAAKGPTVPWSASGTALPSG